jgi:hypothetical protein
MESRERHQFCKNLREGLVKLFKIKYKLHYLKNSEAERPNIRSFGGLWVAVFIRVKQFGCHPLGGSLDGTEAAVQVSVVHVNVVHLI